MAHIAFDEEYGQRMAQRRTQIMQRVEDAVRASGRTLDEVTVCAVSKTVDVDAVAAARAAGYANFAENRPQELERKLGLIADDPAFADASWHMIGNLQENKINHVLDCRPVLVHSIASAALARAVSKRAVVRGMRQAVLLEVNVSGELSKSGMEPDDLRRDLADLTELPGIEIRGLMTMAPQGDRDVARTTFAGLRALRDELAGQTGPAHRLTELSMGMSEDFEEALLQGATIIRLGRVAFDPSFPF